ncbi:MAG: HAD family phosphatase [Ahrensia sp.]
MSNPLIIFDCDGVLIDSEAIYLDVEFSFLASKKIDIDRDWYIGEFMALGMDKWRAKLSDLLLAHTGAALTDAEYDALKLEGRTRVLNELTTIAGIETLLDNLALPCCVASSTSMKFLPGKLKQAGLAGYFGDHVFSGDQVENGKPAPDLFLLAARTMGFDAQDCIVIEDSANGVRGGKAAGMVTVGFTGGGHAGPAHAPRLVGAGADHVIDSHGALAHWLASRTGKI